VLIDGSEEPTGMSPTESWRFSIVVHGEPIVRKECEARLQAARRGFH
jgi:hypothetical protein